MLWNPDQAETVYTHPLLVTKYLFFNGITSKENVIQGMSFIIHDTETCYVGVLTPTSGIPVTCSEVSCSPYLSQVFHYIDLMPSVYIGAVYYNGTYHLIPQNYNSRLHSR